VAKQSSKLLNDMAKISDFRGIYKKQGNSFVRSFDDQVLKMIIAHRKGENSTASKPKDFILFSNGRSRPQYWSSLYPTDAGNIYSAEYAGTYFDVEVSADGLTVKERSSK